jgi:hypothetical protein
MIFFATCKKMITPDPCTFINEIKIHTAVGGQDKNLICLLNFSFSISFRFLSVWRSMCKHMFTRFKHACLFKLR